MKNFHFLFLSIFLFNIQSLAQNPADIFRDYKTESCKLNFVLSNRNSLMLSNPVNPDRIKSNLQHCKMELKKYSGSNHVCIFQMDSTIRLDHNFELLDFYIYNGTNESYRVVARLRCTSCIYAEMVKLKIHFYNHQTLVSTDSALIDYVTYGSFGMLPYQTSFLETFTQKVDFDSVFLNVGYQIEAGSSGIYWDQLLAVKESRITEENQLYKWKGIVQNQSDYSMTFPAIFAGFFKKGRMIDLTYAFLNITEALPDSVIIFSVTTHPTDTEQVSLQNCEDKDVDLSGWAIGDEINPGAFKIPENTFLSPGEIKRFGHDDLGFQINDTRVRIYLSNADGTLIDVWEDTVTVFKVMIYSVTVKPTESEQVSIQNTENFDVDLSGWTIGDAKNPVAFVIPKNSILLQGEIKQYSHDILNFPINDTGEKIYLSNADGTLIDMWEADSSTIYDVKIYSVTTAPTDSEQVSLQNQETFIVNISNWTIGDAHNPFAFTIPEHSFMPPGQIKSFSHDMLGFSIDDAAAKIYLSNEMGTTIDLWKADTTSVFNVKIYSVTVSPTADEQVTLINYETFDVDLSGWTIGDKNKPTAYRIPQGTILTPGAAKIFDHNQLGFGINDKKEIIYLMNENGITIDIWYGPTLLLSATVGRFLPYTTATFETDLNLPDDYDEVKFYLTYALTSLEGNGNITPNRPVFTQRFYCGEEKLEMDFRLFVLDHEKEPVRVKLDWGDGAESEWTKVFPSGQLALVNHAYAVSGIYVIKSKAKDSAESESFWSDSVGVLVTESNSLSIDTAAQLLPNAFYMDQNYPNPFNPVTTIHFGLPEPAEVTISIYNSLGEKVADLFKGNQIAGLHNVNWDASGYASGVYFIRMQAGEFTGMRRCVVVK